MGPKGIAGCHMHFEPRQMLQQTLNADQIVECKRALGVVHD